MKKRLRQLLCVVLILTIILGSAAFIQGETTESGLIVML